MLQGSKPYFLSPGEGKAVWFLGALMTFKAEGETTVHGFGLISPSYHQALHRHPIFITRRKKPSTFWKELSR